MTKKNDNKVTGKAKVHTRYRNLAGDIVPGVTTIVGLLAKPQLIIWANRLGLEGIDSTKYTDAMADIGTLAHYLIMCHIKGNEPDTSDYSANQLEAATNCYNKYLAWEANHTIEPLLVECQLISEVLKVGGTPDLYCLLDGCPTLIDFKTGKAIYEEYEYQVAGYRAILREHGNQVDKCIILRIGRDESEGFEELVMTDIDTSQSIFLCLLSVYYLKKGWKK